MKTKDKICADPKCGHDRDYHYHSEYGCIKENCTCKNFEPQEVSPGDKNHNESEDSINTPISKDSSSGSDK